MDLFDEFFQLEYPYMFENFQLWNYLQTLNKEQLKEYYLKQEYLKKYVSV